MAQYRAPQIVKLLLVAICSILLYQYLNDPNSYLNTRRNFRRPKLVKRPYKDSVMSAAYLKAIANRRSIYSLAKESTVPLSRIQEILTEIIKYSPTAFNTQATRVVLLVETEHEKLWDMADEVLKSKLPERGYNALHKQTMMFRAAYGSVLFFEDDARLQESKAKNSHGHEMPFEEWGQHSSGMAQIHTWDALTLEGLGCNLQHYNMFPTFQDKVIETWKLPKSWVLKSQMVFGKPTGGPKEKTFDTVEGERLLTFGA